MHGPGHRRARPPQAAVRGRCTALRSPTSAPGPWTNSADPTTEQPQRQEPAASSPREWIEHDEVEGRRTGERTNAFPRASAFQAEACRVGPCPDASSEQASKERRGDFALVHSQTGHPIRHSHGAPVDSRSTALPGPSVQSTSCTPGNTSTRSDQDRQKPENSRSGALRDRFKNRHTLHVRGHRKHVQQKHVEGKCRSEPHSPQIRHGADVHYVQSGRHVKNVDARFAALTAHAISPPTSTPQPRPPP